VSNADCHEQLRFRTQHDLRIASNSTVKMKKDIAQDEQQQYKTTSRSERFDQTFLANRAGALSYTKRIPFPLKLFQMLDDVEQGGNESIICWSGDGRSFRVLNANEFFEKVMPHYFRQTRYKSFQRQLHLYGFVRITEGKDKGYYQHHQFVKSNRDLCQEMVRLPVKRKVADGLEEGDTKLYIQSGIGKFGNQAEFDSSLLGAMDQKQPLPSFLGMGKNGVFPRENNLLNSSIKPDHQISNERKAPPCKKRSARFILEDPHDPTGMAFGNFNPGVTSLHPGLNPFTSPREISRQPHAIPRNQLAANQHLLMNMPQAGTTNHASESHSIIPQFFQTQPFNMMSFPMTRNTGRAMKQQMNLTSRHMKNLLAPHSISSLQQRIGEPRMTSVGQMGGQHHQQQQPQPQQGIVGTMQQANNNGNQVAVTNNADFDPRFLEPTPI
jgi:hypothetical protein